MLTAFFVMLREGFEAALIVAILYAYLPEVFPTTLRGLGAGIANGLGRLAGFGGAFLIPVLAAGFGFVGVYVGTAISMVLCGLTVFLFGERTKGRALEDIVSDEPLRRAV